MTELLAIGANTLLSKFVLLSLVIIVIGFVLRLLQQPSIITYILVGALVGPGGLEFITEEQLISNLGDLGLTLLLFFIGMEISLPNLIANWKISVIGTALQVLFSIFVVYLLSFIVDWPFSQVIFFGFVISLSSTAVIVKLLDDRGEINSLVGQNVIGILLAQDVLIVLMIIMVNYLGGELPKKEVVLTQVAGAVLIIGIILYVIKKKHISFPFAKYIRKDHELQVFVAFTLCFGFSSLTALFHLSSALGAFVAGILVSSSRSTSWISESLHPFRVFFVALFFVSIGILIDPSFIKENGGVIALLVFATLITNHLINAFVMRLFGLDWRKSLYGGALLAQLGEFSFILGSSGFVAGIIDNSSYQLIVSVIALSLLFSPLWIILTKRIVKPVCLKDDIHLMNSKNELK